MGGIAHEIRSFPKLLFQNTLFVSSTFVSEGKPPFHASLEGTIRVCFRMHMIEPVDTFSIPIFKASIDVC